jgi:hypothetical protein
LGLETIFYCLRFETSLFVASYDSQGHGGGILPSLHTGIQLNEETTDSLNASTVGALTTFKSFVPMNWKKKRQTQHNLELSFLKAITDVTGKSPQRRRNGERL